MPRPRAGHFCGEGTLNAHPAIRERFDEASPECLRVCQHQSCTAGRLTVPSPGQTAMNESERIAWSLTCFQSCGRAVAVTDTERAVFDQQAAALDLTYFVEANSGIENDNTAKALKTSHRPKAGGDPLGPLPYFSVSSFWLAI